VGSPKKDEYRNRFSVDGIMIGRAAIGYQRIFNEIKTCIKLSEHLAPHD
jgi:tRNA-dihydrouridine synthase